MNKKSMWFGKHRVDNVKRFPMWKGLSAEEIAKDIKTAKPRVRWGKSNRQTWRHSTGTAVRHPFAGVERDHKRADESRALRQAKRTQAVAAGNLPWRRSRA